MQEMLTDVKELQSEASSCNNDNNTVALSDAIGQNEKLRLEMFRQFVKERRDGNQLKTRAEHAQLYSEARRLDILEKAPLVLTEILLTANIMEEISEHQSLLRYFCKQGHQFQKYFVYGLEQIICLHIDILLEKVPIILQLCFDSLGLFVSPILEWAENGSVEYIPKDISKKIRDSAQPFLHPHQQNERKQRFL